MWVRSTGRCSFLTVDNITAYSNAGGYRKAEWFFAIPDEKNSFFGQVTRFDEHSLEGTHDVPDVDGLLQSQFEAHSAAVEEFGHFVSAFRIHGYKKAWQQYCEITHAGTASPVFMAATINDGSPYSALEQFIRALLRPLLRPASLSPRPMVAPGSAVCCARRGLR
jgi:hypothetical protein